MPDRLPRKTKLLYGAGDIGFSLTTTIIGAFFAIFLTDVVGLSPGAAGTAIFVGSTWDYVNDPIMATSLTARGRAGVAGGRICSSVRCPLPSRLP